MDTNILAGSAEHICQSSASWLQIIGLADWRDGSDYTPSAALPKVRRGFDYGGEISSELSLARVLLARRVYGLNLQRPDRR
jgi:hypothetical protein